MNQVTVAVVSDLHAYDHYDPTTAAPSHLCTLAPEDQPSRHPFAGLRRLIDQAKLQATYLLCCGDMADRARPAGIQYVWRHLQDLKDRLGARLIATPGNHDLDSRYQSSDDAKGVLQALVPTFPFIDEGLTDKFWARNYAIIEDENTRLVVLNSSAYHGTKPDAYQHGRIALSTAERLQGELAARRKDIRPVNIFLCHHHPQRFGNVDLADYSEMKDGHLILEMLGSGLYGDWIVVHGHKHFPRLAYASGSASAPVIFSAGSLSANLYVELQSRVRNQFYVITFPWEITRALRIGMAGTFRSWDWDYGLGWLPATPRSGLPAVGAFGYRADSVTAIAVEIAAIYEGSRSPYIAWGEILAHRPQVAYLMPSDLETVVSLLKDQHSIVVVRDDIGRIVQIGASL